MTAAVPTQRHPADPVPGLLARAQAGDADAYGDLYRRYHDTVYRYVRNRAPRAAEDITQETFLRAWRRIGSFTWQGHALGAWLVTIARNLISDHYKSAPVQRTTAYADLAPFDRSDGRDHPAVAAMAAESAAVLGDVLAGMRHGEQRRCLQLRFLAGLSLNETAAVLGIRVGAVKSLQMRACLAARRELTARGMTREVVL